MSHDIHLCKYIHKQMCTDTLVLKRREAFLNKSRHMSKRALTYIWMSHGTHLNESWHTFECAMSRNRCTHTHICIYTRETQFSGDRHVYKWVMAHIWMSHGTHLNESWHTSECAMSRNRCTQRHPVSRGQTRLSMGHGTHLNESWHTPDVHTHTDVYIHVYIYIYKQMFA